MTDRRHLAYPPQGEMSYPSSQWNGANQLPSQYPPPTGHYTPISHPNNNRIIAVPHQSVGMYGSSHAQPSGMPYQGEYYAAASSYPSDGTRSSSTSVPQQPLYASMNQTYPVTHSSRHHPNSHSRNHSQPHSYSSQQSSRQPPVMAPPNTASHYPQQVGFPQPMTSTQYPASPSRPFSCDMCALSFNRQHDLKRHRETHTGEKPFLCKGCGKTFTRKDALKRHQLVKQCGNEDDDA